MQDRFKFRIWNGSEMHYNDFVVTATGFVGKITEEFCGQCSFNQEDLTADKECVLQQCTGLKDKNGKLICEGDVVKVCDVSALGYVRERIGKVVYGYSFYPAFVIETTFGDIKDFTEDIEILGNIYENPELLESEGEQCKKQ